MLGVFMSAAVPFFRAACAPDACTALSRFCKYQFLLAASVSGGPRGLHHGPVGHCVCEKMDLELVGRSRRRDKIAADYYSDDSGGNASYSS